MRSWNFLSFEALLPGKIDVRIPHFLGIYLPKFAVGIPLPLGEGSFAAALTPASRPEAAFRRPLPPTPSPKGRGRFGTASVAEPGLQRFTGEC